MLCQDSSFGTNPRSGALLSLTHSDPAIGLAIGRSRFSTSAWQRCILLILLWIPLGSFPSTAMGQEQLSRPSVIDRETEDAVTKSLDWLASRQQANGAFGSGDNYRQNVGVTSLCGMAFLSAGSVPDHGPYSEHVSKTIDFVLSCSRANGFIVEPDAKTHGPMYGHGFATMFLAEVYGMSAREDLRARLKLAVDLIIRSQNDHGGWRYTPGTNEEDISVTVCQMMALRAARNAGIAVPKEVISNAVDYVKRCQNPDGGFRYRLFDSAESKAARSAAAIVALYMAGESETVEIERGLAYLKLRTPSADKLDYYSYFQYYHVQALWQTKTDQWTVDFTEIRDELLKRMSDDHWSDATIGDEYATAMVLIALQIPYDLVPIFER